MFSVTIEVVRKKLLKRNWVQLKLGTLCNRRDDLKFGNSNGRQDKQNKERIADCQGNLNSRVNLLEVLDLQVRNDSDW